MKDINPMSPLSFASGHTMINRFMLAPMTNSQSGEDGILSDDEFNWLVKRAEGGFGIVCTCAAHVDFLGKGFPGQLGIYDDNQIPGHQKLAKGIKSYGSLALIQLHHAGMRSPEKLIGEAPLCPSADEKTGARAMTLDMVVALRESFIAAAVRAQKSGYDGVQIHGAHSYILGQFLSADINRRTDIYGGRFKNRARLIHEIVTGVRKACGANFIVSLRLSPERFGMDINEIRQLCLDLDAAEELDFLDISLWDVFKMPEDEKYKDQSLLAHFTSLDLKYSRLTVAGKISDAKDVQEILNSKIDFVSIGKSAILHYNFPKLVAENENFKAQKTPVSREYLDEQGLGEKFKDYMSKWPGFVAEENVQL
jgi:2,4-dienoyl-CoA reductase-like NADH-dependent reductase (Old Yellow Enzyme family)